MSFRVSFILLVLVAVVGGYVFLFQLQDQGEVALQNPWFYDVGFGDITGVSVTYLGDTQDFNKSPEGWIFQETGEPVDMQRWGGIVLLLTGPRSSRVLVEHVENPEEYGLAPALTRISVTVVGGREILMSIGDKTPDSRSSYAMVDGSTTLFTVPSDWADILNRLVTEPPVLPPTPEAEQVEGA